jgi:class 3 adenylate cyclase
MVDATERVDLPPAHIGIHAGPVVIREGDYFGRTVNWAARISGRAGPGEVLVTQDVVDASHASPTVFEPVGPTELKGISAPVPLFRARRSSLS